MITVIDDDRQFPWFSPVCTFCRHRTGFRKCSAFANEIPIDIWVGEDSHERPFPGDHGILFEPVPGAKITRPQIPTATS